MTIGRCHQFCAPRSTTLQCIPAHSLVILRRRQAPYNIFLFFSQRLQPAQARHTTSSTSIQDNVSAPHYQPETSWGLTRSGDTPRAAPVCRLRQSPCRCVSVVSASLMQPCLAGPACEAGLNRPSPPRPRRVQRTAYWSERSWLNGQLKDPSPISKTPHHQIPRLYPGASPGSGAENPSEL